MPVPELMTWIPQQRRWTKMYSGRRYYISARKLGCPETKEGSIHAANQWWRDKQAEIDYAEKVRAAHCLRMPMPMDDLATANSGLSADLFGNVRELLERALLAEEAERQRGKPTPTALPGAPPETIVEIPIDPPDPDEGEALRRREIMAMLEKLIFGDKAKLTMEQAKRLPPSRVQQIESAVQSIRGDGAGVNPARTVKALSEEWLGGQKDKVRSENMTAGRYRTIAGRISHFCVFVGDGTDVSGIDAERLDGFHSFCLSKIADKREGREGGWAPAYTKAIFEDVNKFVRWLWKRKLIEMPRNLGDHTFRVPTNEVPNWTPDEIRQVVGQTSGKLRLAILLMCNTGMTQKDISDLQDKEVDWSRRTITRCRAKLKHRKNAPTITYPLWAETFALLKEHRSGKDNVILTDSGQTYVRQEITATGIKYVDIIATNFNGFKKRHGFSKPLKQLRKTGATLLDKYDPSGTVATWYLGHSPRSMKDKHYSRPDQEHFDRAITWLGQQLGFVPE